MRRPSRPLPATDDVPPQVAEAVRAWLDGFSQAVRDRDYVAGRGHFAEDVVAFGTRARALVGLDEVEESQWRGVWAATQGFEFTDSRTLTWRIDDRAMIAVVAATWASSAVEPSGATRRRVGRATLLLEGARASDEPLHCRHSHFSLDPTEWTDSR